MDTEAIPELPPEAIPELPPEAEARMATLLETQRRARVADQAARDARRSLWRTHHWPDQYHRCARVGGVVVCRRCLALYPLTLVLLALFAGEVVAWPTAADPWLIWVLCVPATAEFLLEKLAGWQYSARRQVIVTMLVAPALGHGLALEIDDRWSPQFWGPVAVFGTIWFLAAAAEARHRMFEDALAASLRDAESSARREPQPTD